MEAIGLREAARRLGVSHAAVQKRIKSGTLKTLPDGKIDGDTLKQQWTSNRDESKVRRSAVAPASAKEPDPPAEDPATTSERNFIKAKTDREYVRLEKDQLDLAIQKGELVGIGPINAYISGMIVRAKEILLKIEPELQDRIGRQNARLVGAEIERALNELAEYKPAA